MAVPEIQEKNPAVYSFRDLVAIRTISFLRKDISLQKIRKAFANLDPLDLTEHPSEYKFGTDGTTIGVADQDGRVIDLVRSPGQISLFTFEEVFSTFTNKRGIEVVDFLRPRAHLDVNPGRMGGWPTIDGSRVTYDTIADLVDGDSITVEDIPFYYPSVSAAAAEDAVSFDAQVKASVGAHSA